MFAFSGCYRFAERQFAARRSLIERVFKTLRRPIFPFYFQRNIIQNEPTTSRISKMRLYVISKIALCDHIVSQSRVVGLQFGHPCNQSGNIIIVSGYSGIKTICTSFQSRCSSLNRCCTPLKICCAIFKRLYARQCVIDAFIVVFDSVFESIEFVRRDNVIGRPYVLFEFKCSHVTPPLCQQYNMYFLQKTPELFDIKKKWFTTTSFNMY